MSKSSKIEESTSTNSKKGILLKARSLVSRFFSPQLFAKDILGDEIYNLVRKLKSDSSKMPIEEKSIFLNLLKFSQVTVEDVMIPRSDIKALKLSTSVVSLSQMLNNTVPHTRMLVYNETLDDIIGFVHIKDLFKLLITGEQLEWNKIIRKPIISAPSMKLIDLLVKMRRDRVQISVVVDEYGGTDGIITIEDIMEAIVGRIDDEHDEQSDNDGFKLVNKNTILSNARVKVEDLELALGVTLKTEDDEFDTIGGLVLAKIGHVPSVGAKINIANQVELEVIDANPRLLKQVRLQLIHGAILPNISS